MDQLSDLFLLTFGQVDPLAGREEGCLIMKEARARSRAGEKCKVFTKRCEECVNDSPVLCSSEHKQVKPVFYLAQLIAMG